MSLDLKGPAGLSEPIAGKAQLVDYFRGAEKPRSQWQAGVEHEKIGIVDGTFEAVPYYGDTGIRSILDALARSAGGSQHAHRENGQPIAVLKDGASVTLEPGGQLELSGVPHRSLRAAGQRYRIIYQVDNGAVIVYVVLIGLRKEGSKADIYELAQRLVRLGLLDPDTH